MPEVAPEIVIATDRRGEVLFSNQSFRELPESSQSELNQETIVKLCNRVTNSRLQETHEFYRQDAKACSRRYSCVFSAPSETGSLIGAFAVCVPQNETKSEQKTKSEQRRLENAISIQRATLDATADGILVVDSQGMIISYNQRLLEIWNIPGSVVEGKPYQEALMQVLDQLEDPEECIMRLEHIMAQPEVLSHDVLNFKSGKILERFSRPQKVDGSIRGRVFSYRDITERVRAEERSNESAAQLKALVETSRIVAEARLNLRSILDSATRTVAEFFRDGCAVCLFSKGSNNLETVSFYHTDHETSDAFGSKMARVRSLIDDRIVAEINRNQRPIVISGSLEKMRACFSHEFAELIDRFPVFSLALAPMRLGGEVMGFVTVFRFRSVPYSSRDAEFLQDLADRTALAISNAALHLETRNALRLRDDFIRLASHELRTPLTALSLELHLLLKRCETAQRGFDVKSLIHIIRKASASVSRLVHLVHEVLEMANLANGLVVLTSEKTDLSAAVVSAVEQYQPRLKAVRCTLQLEAAQQVIGYWDRSRIEEFIQHIMGSVIASSKKKVLQIFVSQEGNHAQMKIRVGKLPFKERNYGRLAEVERVLAVERLGMGFYLANEIAKAHGGWLRFYGDIADEFVLIAELPLARPRMANLDAERASA